VLRNYTAPSNQEVQDIIALKKKYPFSQTLHVLSAKISKDHRSETQQRELQQAAVYSTDRAVLKDIMTMDLVASGFSISSKKSIPDISEDADADGQKKIISDTVSRSAGKTSEAHLTTQKKADGISEENLVVYQQITNTIDYVDVADTVIRDLKRLSELKHNFELLFADQASLSIPAIKVAEEGNEIKEGVKTRREKIIAAAKTLTRSQHASTGATRKKKKDTSSDIIEEIKTSKEEIEPGSERLKEQIEIIDQFIKTQPSITSVRDRNPLPPTDLNSIKSGEFGENIVSETLVEILIKQGKKDRAIEVLKKLIWKYPQKKAYFASQIEDLKK